MAPRPLLSQASSAALPVFCDEPVFVQIQPMPIDLAVAYTTVGNVTVTAIERHWLPGEAARCQLCPRHLCTVGARNSCLVQVPRYVSYAAAALAPLVLPGQGLPSARIDAHPHGA